MMLRGLWKLTWIELKVFLREPMGAFGTIGVPVLIFLVLGRYAHFRFGGPAVAGSILSGAGLPVLASILIAISTVLSLVTIIAIYREGGILKRLRATPLRPQTILSAHVIVKLLLTVATLLLMFLAGKRYIPPDVHPPIVSLHHCAGNQYREPFVDWICHRQHRSHGAIRAANRSGGVVPPGRTLGIVCARRIIPAGLSRSRAPDADELRREPARRHLGRRAMVGPPCGCGRAGGVLRAVYGGFG